VNEGRNTEPMQDEHRQYLAKVTREAGFAFGGKVFGLFFGFVAQAVFARLLGADILGVFVLGWTVVYGVTILSTLGFEHSLVRYLSEYASSNRPREARAVFLLGARLSLVLGVLAVGAIFLFRTPIAFRVFKEFRLESVLVWMALAVIPFGFMRVLAGALRGLKDIKSFTLGFDVSFRVFRFIVFLALFSLGLRLYGIVGATIVATFLSVGLLVFFLRKRGPFLFDRSVTPATVPTRGIVVYTSQMLADAFVAFAMQHSGRIVLGIYLESADVGVYNIAALMGTLVTFVLLSFNSIFSPVIADLFHRDRFDLLVSLFRSVTRWTIILSLPILLWIIVAGEATLAVFGREFLRGYDALVLLSAGRMIAISMGPVGIALAMTGYQKWNVYNAVVLAVVTVVLNVVLVPKMGVTGAGLATGAAQALVKIARMIQVRYLLKINPYDRSSVKVGITVVVSLAIAILTRRYVDIPPGFVTSVVVMVASLALVAALTVVLGVKEEDRMVLGTVLRKLRRQRGGAANGNP